MKKDVRSFKTCKGASVHQICDLTHQNIFAFIDIKSVGLRDPSLFDKYFPIHKNTRTRITDIVRSTASYWSCTSSNLIYL